MLVEETLQLGDLIKQNCKTVVWSWRLCDILFSFWKLMSNLRHQYAGKVPDKVVYEPPFTTHLSTTGIPTDIQGEQNSIKIIKIISITN